MQDKNSPDILIIFTIVTLLMIGLIMILSASSVRAYDLLNDSYYFFKRQLISAGLGLIVMIITMKIDYHIYKRFSILILFVTLFLLIIVLVPGIGRMSGGSRRWLGFGSLGFQPSTAAKLGIIIYFSQYFSQKNRRISSFWKGILPPLIVLVVVFMLILLEPDLGTAVTIGMTFFIMLFVSGARISHLIFMGLTGMGAIMFFIFSSDYRRRRFTAFINPWEDPLDSGYHIIQSLLALGTGGVFGVGLGNSKQKFFYLPEPGTDFIFSVLGEELGYLGVIFVLGLYLLLCWRGIRTAYKAPDLFGTMLSIGITSMIIIQVFINIGVVSASIPVTGITLPFISYGGSSILIMLAGVGILLNISQSTNNN